MRHREAKPRVVATISRELKKLEDDGQDLAEELLKELAALREAYDEDQRVKSAMEYPAAVESRDRQGRIQRGP